MCVLALAAAMVTAQTAAPAVKAPDTPAGRGLAEVVESSDAGGDTRRTWRTDR